MALNQLYYNLKPLIPRSIQIFLRQQFAAIKRRFYKDVWPIDVNAAKLEKPFKKWPHDYRFALLLSHDVDTLKGQNQCEKLMDLEEALGFRSSFNFVPERYTLDIELIKKVKQRGFEVCIHGLKHDGKLFSSKKIFNERAKKINKYIKEWDISGFTAPSMICNMEWVHNLNIKHSTCTFDTDPFEPVPKGIGTIFPFVVENKNKRFVELPYTLPQDHTLFIIMREKNLNIWIEKIEWIAECGGMALLNTHPDYMNFSKNPNAREEYSCEFYRKFLMHVIKKYKGQYWHALPDEVADYIIDSELK